MYMETDHGENFRRYWQFLLLLFLLCATLHALLSPIPAMAKAYTTLLGALGLSIEAMLPLPQLHVNYVAQSCKGFRLSVLVNWLLGDAMKMCFFFLSADDRVPWPFKACGIFQAVCDVCLGLQYWMYGNGEEEDRDTRLQ
jgi:solute carrier family 66, member 2